MPEAIVPFPSTAHATRIAGSAHQTSSLDHEFVKDLRYPPAPDIPAARRQPVRVAGLSQTGGASPSLRLLPYFRTSAHVDQPQPSQGASLSVDPLPVKPTSPHYSWTFLLQSRIRRYDRPACKIRRHAGKRARRSDPQHTFSSRLRAFTIPRARHGRLTDSPAFTDLPRLIRRGVNLVTRLRHFVTNRHE